MVSPIFFPHKTDDFLFLFCSSLISLGCHPLEGVTPDILYLSDLISLLFFVNSATISFSFGCHPSGWCHPGRSATHPPPSDATESGAFAGGNITGDNTPPCLIPGDMRYQEKFCDTWPDDLNIETRPRYSEDVPANQKFIYLFIYYRRQKKPRATYTAVGTRK